MKNACHFENKKIVWVKLYNLFNGDVGFVNIYALNDPQ
jgi:hypothetical protein